jgi:hypothetical protein
MQLLSRIPLMYVRCVCVCVCVHFAAMCHYRRFVCVSGTCVCAHLARTAAPDTHTNRQ